MKLIYGAALNDSKDPVIKRVTVVSAKQGKQKQKTIWKCPYYTTWYNMLSRCYSKKYQIKNKSYEFCEVSEEWLLFSNFKSWMEKQDWLNKELDKDLLVPGNKIYSKETCMFIDRRINSFIVSGSKSRTSKNIGFIKLKSGKYRASCRNPFSLKNERIGNFDTPEEANKAWLTRKRAFAKILAEQENNLFLKEILNKLYL